MTMISTYVPYGEQMVLLTEDCPAQELETCTVCAKPIPFGSIDHCSESCLRIDAIKVKHILEYAILQAFASGDRRKGESFTKALAAYIESFPLVEECVRERLEE